MSEWKNRKEGGRDGWTDSKGRKNKWKDLMDEWREGRREGGMNEWKNRKEGGRNGWTDNKGGKNMWKDKWMNGGKEGGRDERMEE